MLLTCPSTCQSCLACQSACHMFYTTTITSLMSWIYVIMSHSYTATITSVMYVLHADDHITHTSQYHIFIHQSSYYTSHTSVTHVSQSVTILLAWFWHNRSSIVPGVGGGVGGTPYDGLYREAPPQKGQLFHASGIWKGRDFTSWGI